MATGTIPARLTKRNITGTTNANGVLATSYTISNFVIVSASGKGVHTLPMTSSNNTWIFVCSNALYEKVANTSVDIDYWTIP